MNILKQAVIITLNDRYVERTEIGLYTPSDSSKMSELRWCKSPIRNATAGIWRPHFIAKISPISKKANLMSFGGGVMSNVSFTIEVYNNDQLSLKLEELGIYLQGKDVEIYELEGTDDCSDSIACKRRASGVIQGSYKWSDRYITLSCSWGRDKKRASLSHVEPNGNMLPVTFGSSDPANGRFFKIPRTKDIEQDISSGDIAGSEAVAHIPNMNLYPEFEYHSETDEIKISFRIGEYTGLSEEELENALIGNFIVVEETGTETQLLNGIHRKIKEYLGRDVIWGPEHHPGYIVQVTLQDYFPIKPEGNTDGTHENQVWYKIKHIEIEYQTESKNTQGFYDSETGEAIDYPELYTKEDEKMIRVLSTACDVDTKGNRIIINPRMINSDTNQIQTLQIEPIKTLEEYNEPDLSEWGIENTLKLASGFYRHGEGGNWSTSNYSGIGLDTSPVYDRDHSTNCHYSIEFSSSLINYFVAFRFLFPDIPESLKFSNVYLGIRASTVILNPDLPNFDRGAFRVLTRGHVGRLKTRIDADEVEFHPGTVLNAVGIENLPDFYYKTDRETGNNAFFISQENDKSLTGLEKFDLGITNHDEYNNITECLVLIKKFLIPTATNRTGTEVTSIHQLALIFENQATLGSEIYV